MPWPRPSPAATPINRVSRGGAAAQHQNNFNAFDNGVQAGQTQQSATDQAYDKGYQAGLAQSNSGSDQAYTNGYNDRAVEESVSTSQAFDNGFRMGRDEQLRLDDRYP